VTATERALMALKAAARRTGLELKRFNPTNSLDAARPLVVREQQIDLVVDVGANAGQWARELRAVGYGGAIVSFEPLAAAYAELEEAAAGDAAWSTRRLALGDATGEAELHVAGNDGASSSLLEMGPAHLQAAPAARYVGTERVPVARLDDVELLPVERLFLKLDVQGAERAVLAGARETLLRVRVVECELSLVELYEGQALLEEQLALLREAGFAPWSLQGSFADPSSGRLLQADGIFVRG
jgi:FkbM family methyltransferase